MYNSLPSKVNLKELENTANKARGNRCGNSTNVTLISKSETISAIQENSKDMVGMK